MLKKLFCLLLLAISLQGIAQKVYQTKTGKVSFFSSTKIEDIEAINNQADAKLATNGQMVVLLAVKGFKFDNAVMQEHFNENYMESDKYPKGIFMGNIAEISKVNFSKEGIYPVTVNGNLEIHGIKKPVKAVGTIEVKGEKVKAKSTFKITIADYGIKGSYIGDKIAKEIEVTVDCTFI